ncbi:methyltransferase [Xanthomonas vesicatoria ATCC 35937]|uniref:Methyltransferase, FkbM family n=1 Tax=Xanthomonas vesicatoria ATCC 35937 TaxID=925775 RepID=F0BJM5_9XANT|nr:FkbM family methyltransferase [Xanthomonas vesicatoria]APP74106.1 methyltransferase [Xanthomonas vesicatoria ATCC 35937]EGD07321.1 methyltransferase, FkbM family [Xanthomonas vesicatoria ATCC 35937]KTF35634.1 methyltransferase [Xanthomonas vesicatoria]MCC8595461.1 FkbM family methyltransferase [Xanthomonas vesicatoria]MCC8604245.1 FkbM family methyltransferase [Xanthomonas vesicatoria]
MTFMNSRNEQLREQILRIAEQERPALEDVIARLPAIANRPVFLVAPESYIGMVHGPRVVADLRHVVAAIDDQNTHLDHIHGAPRWSSQEFLAKAGQYADAIAIDFACSPRGRAFAHDICTSAGIEQLSVAPSLEPLIPHFEQRPLFLLQPRSGLGNIYGPQIVQRSSHIIAAVDDQPSDSDTVHGVPRWSSRQFIEQAAQHSQALAIDFSYSPKESGLARKLCDQAGIERVDACMAVAHCGLLAVYEPAQVYRQRTLLRLDEFLRFADRLDDDLSVFTLYSNLLFRVTYDSSFLLDCWATPINEYFSEYADSSTFQLGQSEHFCDGGAFQGPVVHKFIDASRYRYESITAFEPDSINFQTLEGIASALPIPPHNFKAIKKAISNEHATLRFEETGTVSSHVSPNGGISVATTRLDDELEKLTLLKLDIEGFEARALEGASHLIRTQRPRMAICVYHYAQDLLDIVEQLDRLVEGYHFRLRQHSPGHYYDLVLYASPVAGAAPPPWAM